MAEDSTDEKENSDDAATRSDATNWKKLAKAAGIGMGKLALSAGKAAAKGIVEGARAIDRKITENAELSSRQGSWTAHTDAVTLFEAVMKSLTTEVSINDPSRWWRSINPLTPYMELHCNAHWIDSNKNPYGTVFEYPTTTKCVMKFVPTGESTRIDFTYAVQSRGFEASAGPLIKLTNEVVRDVCARYPAPPAASD